MSEALKDGGPAFPLQSIGPDFAPGYGGMTLRDYFAGQWLAAGHHENLTPEDAAERAYDCADAMLTAREARHD